MKISRNKNIITIEMEESDAPPGADLEIVADNLMAGMKLFMLNPKLAGRGLNAIQSDPAIVSECERTVEDQLQKWEL